MALVNEATYSAEPGMDDIRLVMSGVYDQNLGERIVSDRIVGAFGITRADGFKEIIFWKVDKHRRDKRHGAIDPVPQSTYGTSLLESMFKGWNT